MSGCGLLKKEVDPYAQIPVKSNELSDDIYYVKKGTNFYAAQKIKNRNDSLIWMAEDEQLVPTLYKGEIIAIASGKLGTVHSVPMNRYKDMGYSVGITNIMLDEKGQLSYTLENCVKSSPAEKYFKQDKSKQFAIVTINSEKVNSQMIDQTSGIFTNMEKNGEYTFEYYAGTYFEKVTLTATMHCLQYYENYTLTNIKDTRNGYLEVSIPEDYKSGWYEIDGYFFKYVNHKRDGSPDPVLKAWNEPYFSSTAVADDNSQVYSASLNKTTTNVLVKIDGKTADGTDLYCHAVSPDGTDYLVSKKVGSENIYELILARAMAGKWHIYVSPKDAVVADVSITSSELEKENMEEIKEFTFETEKSVQTFKITFEGRGEITANLVDSNGMAYPFKFNKSQGVGTCNMIRVPADTYKVQIFHDTQINIIDIEVMDGTFDGGEDIINITG